MRESIGATWTMQIVIVFILFFVAFITLTINYTRAFKVKNEIISIIEREDGFTYSATTIKDGAGARELIASYLTNSGYSATGKCDVNWVGVKSIAIKDNNDYYPNNYEKITEENKDNKYYYCIQKVQVPVKGKTNPQLYNYNNRAYYKVRLFFKFSIPVFGDLTTFKVEGESLEVYFNGDELELWNQSVDGGQTVVNTPMVDDSDKTRPTIPTEFALYHAVVNEVNATYKLKIGGSTDDSGRVIYQVNINNNWIDLNANSYEGMLSSKNDDYYIYARACDPSGNCSDNAKRFFHINPSRLYVWQLYQYLRSTDGDVIIPQPSESEIDDNLANPRMAQNAYNMYMSAEANNYFSDYGHNGTLDGSQTLINYYRGILGREYDIGGMEWNMEYYKNHDRGATLKIYVNSEEAQTKIYSKWGLGVGSAQ